MPRVLISYSHDSASHRERVRELAQRLRADGIDAWIDQFELAPPQGWPQWMEQQLEQADFVIVVCTETYRRRFEAKEAPGVGRGARWEGHLVKQRFYQQDLTHETLVPVLFDDASADDIPTLLRASTHISLMLDYEGLRRRLTRTPIVDPAPLGSMSASTDLERGQLSASADPELGQLRTENDLLRSQLATLRSELARVAPPVARALAPRDVFETFALSLREGRPDTVIVADEMFWYVMDALDDSSPRAGASAEATLEALNSTSTMVAGISHVASLAARMNYIPLVERSIPFLEKLLLHYNPPPHFVGSFSERDFDFYKVIGKECFVILVAPFFEEQRWDAVRMLLDAALEVPNIRYRERNESCTYQDFSAGATTGDALHGLKPSSGGSWFSPLGHVLKTRHESGTPPQFDTVTSTDLFLYFTSEISGTPTHHGWWPHTALYIGDPPAFLKRAARTDYARELSRVLGLSDVAALGPTLRLATEHLRKQRGYQDVLRWFDFRLVGTK